MPTMFPDFERMFIDQYAPLDDKNIAQINYKSCGSMAPYRNTSLNSTIL